MTMSFLSFFTTLFFLVLVVNASPIGLIARAALDVYVPKIITPNSDTFWTAGQTGEVTWDASDAPENISNGAYIELSGRDGHTRLPEKVDLRSGHVTVHVPDDVEPGPHFITLFGNSGNYSPVFTIGEPESEE